MFCVGKKVEPFFTKVQKYFPKVRNYSHTLFEENIRHTRRAILEFQYLLIEEYNSLVKWRG